MVCSIAGSHRSVRNAATVSRFGATYSWSAIDLSATVSAACASRRDRNPRRRVCLRLGFPLGLSSVLGASITKYHVPFPACFTLPRRPLLMSHSRLPCSVKLNDHAWSGEVGPLL